MTRGERVLFVAGVFTLALMACMAVFLLTYQDESATPESTATAAPTNTVVATATPEPTQTPSPTFTSTPRPTATPTDRAAAEERAYESWALSVTSQYQRQFFEMSDLFTDASQNPALLTDETWMLDLVLVIINIEELNTEVRAQNPPEKYEGVHEDLVAMSEDMDLMTSNLTEGLDRLDVNLIEAAISNMEDGIDHMEDASRKLEAMN